MNTDLIVHEPACGQIEPPHHHKFDHFSRCVHITHMTRVRSWQFGTEMRILLRYLLTMMPFDSYLLMMSRLLLPTMAVHSATSTLMFNTLIDLVYSFHSNSIHYVQLWRQCCISGIDRGAVVCDQVEPLLRLTMDFVAKREFVEIQSIQLLLWHSL